MPAGLDGRPDPISTPARQAALRRVADRIVAGGAAEAGPDGDRRCRRHRWRRQSPRSPTSSPACCAYVASPPTVRRSTRSIVLGPSGGRRVGRHRWASTAIPTTSTSCTRTSCSIAQHRPYESGVRRTERPTHRHPLARPATGRCAGVRRHLPPPARGRLALIDLVLHRVERVRTRRMEIVMDGCPVDPAHRMLHFLAWWGRGSTATSRASGSTSSSRTRWRRRSGRSTTTISHGP